MKRKRDPLLDFDPNKSDPEDENFEPGQEEDRPRRSKKKQRASRGHRSQARRRRGGYRGSDIDDDDDEVSDDSLENPYSSDNDSDDSDDDAPLTNAAGRRQRKAAAKALDYHESSDDEDEDAEDDEDDDNDDDDEDDDSIPVKRRPKRKTSESPVASRPSLIVALKVNPKALRRLFANEPKVMTRRTRGSTAEADLLELTTSGRHVQPARASRSKSPEALAAALRAQRGSKGLKKPPAPPIDEATQEDSVAHGMEDDDDEDELANVNGFDGVEESTLNESLAHRDSTRRSAAGKEIVSGDGGGEDGEDGGDGGDGDGEVNGAEGAENDVDMEENGADDEDDEDDEDDVNPSGRRTRRVSRATAAASTGAAAADVIDADASPEEEQDNKAGTRRLTRGSRRAKSKSVRDQSSDFEPMDDEESGDGDAFDSDSSPKGKRTRSAAEDDSSLNSRGRRRSTRLKSGTKRGRQESDDEVEIDQDELAMEAEELRASSRNRRRRRQRSPSIVYEAMSRRRTTKVVDYSIKPLDQLLVEQEDEEDPQPFQTPVARRNGRGGNSSTWQRNLMSTFGPFGGGGGVGSLIGGPWGTGAAGGVDSDSSDDEMNFRTGGAGGVGGNVGMTPTTGTAPAGFAAPLNLEAITGVSANANVGKVKNQKALADADPLGVDLTVDFSKVGGLQGHINQLKEMVTLPLLYPELFLRFKVTPPRGVLFHGPPGTGKTLLARALANSVGVGGRKITFYMRKGADALSKWVGEAEKQLRLLFEEARRTQPSIIFFDEIDGLAPVRSSKQEQIHASIVSTLLALMDGMDGRGQVIVIGATNRPDNIDPALRRPGRFDREFYFPLPDLEGRRSIIDIHTKDWGLSDGFKHMLAENSKGYGGADLRALCTEAALNAIQRTYPQIYSAPDKLIVNPEKISIHATDFMLSMNRMVPSSERSAAPAWAALPKAVEPLLSEQLATIKTLLDSILPRRKKTTALEEAMFEPFHDDDHGFGRENMVQEFERSRTFRPRLLLTGEGGMGQGYLSAAILHHFEGFHIQSFDLPILLGDGRPLEQVIVGLFVEVKRHKPAVLYIPNVDVWYHSLPQSAYVTFATMLKTIPSNDPILLLGTCECETADIPPAVLRDFFGYSTKNRYVLQKPSKESRRKYFFNFLKHALMNPSDFPDPANRKKRVLEELPVAPPPPPKIKTKEEIREELRKDHLLLNLLKVQLQPIMDQIKKYKKFRQPAIPETQIQYLWEEADPNYIQPDLVGEDQRPFVIARDKEGLPGLLHKPSNKFYYNLDLSTIEERLSNGYYARPKDFYHDVLSLARDARNLGDKDRLLKANELATNVEVDVAEAEARLSQVNWEELYQRQLRRFQEAEEKASKKKIGLAIMHVGAGNPGRAMDDGDDNVPLVLSDLGPEGGDGDEGALVGQRPMQQQQQQQQQARFALKADVAAAGVVPSSSSPASNGVVYPARSNGTSVPSTGRPGGEDVEMVGSDVGIAPSATGPLPAQWRQPPFAALSSSAVATAGNTQVSQTSALTGLPAGMSPSAVVNEASTTKTSDPSTNRSSGGWSTQRTTNGFGHGGGPGGPGGPGGGGEGPDGGAGGSSQIPDTQSVFGSLPSEGGGAQAHDWVHSQRAADEGSSPHTPSRAAPLGPPPAVRALSQATPGTPGTTQASAVSAASGSGSGSRLSSQVFPISVPESALDPILETMLERTAGCTVDQLEQISRELMDHIWASRHERNRSRVLHDVSKVFNRTIADLEEMQGLHAAYSQET